MIVCGIHTSVFCFPFQGHCLYVLACLRLNNCERAVQALGQVREFHPADDGEVEQTLRKLSTELGWYTHLMRSSWLKNVDSIFIGECFKILLRKHKV